MKMDILNNTKREWRELGFHYDRDDERKEWIFTGSRSGLVKLSAIFKGYALDERNNAEFEHNHYGPYHFFKIMTVHGEKGINDNAIYGSLEDLAYLGTQIEEKATSNNPGHRISLKNIFQPESEYDLILEIREDGFDPTLIDKWIRKKESEQGD